MTLRRLLQTCSIYKPGMEKSPSYASYKPYIKGGVAGSIIGYNAHDQMQMADTNKDGQISKEEAVRSLSKSIGAKIDQYDTNHDGKLTPGELLDGILTDVKKLTTLIGA